VRGNEHFLVSIGLQGMAVCNVHMSEAEEHLAKSGAAREQVSLTMTAR
jgi:hypothetical protein